jgi:hypothetical protein
MAIQRQFGQSRKLQLDHVAEVVRPKMIHNAMVNIQKVADIYKYISAVVALILDASIAHKTAMPPLFDLGRQARPGRQSGIPLYRSLPAEGQNKSW